MSYLAVQQCARTVAQNEADARAWAQRRSADTADLYGECICVPGHCRDGLAFDGRRHDGMAGLQAVCARCAHQPPEHACSAASSAASAEPVRLSR